MEPGDRRQRGGNGSHRVPTIRGTGKSDLDEAFNSRGRRGARLARRLRKFAAGWFVLTNETGLGRKRSVDWGRGEGSLR